MGHARARKIPAQLVEDEEYQLRHERVAGIDIAKAKADVCTRLPPQRDGGRRASRAGARGGGAGGVGRGRGRGGEDGRRLRRAGQRAGAGRPERGPHRKGCCRTGA